MRSDIKGREIDFLEYGRYSGAYRLWLAVTYSALETYKKSGGKDKGARSFLFDERNEFVEVIFDQLEIDPDVMRKRIREKDPS